MTATVAAASGNITPTGTVTFKEGSTTLGTGTLSNGVATFTTSSLSAGTHKITAEYPGNGSNILASHSGPTDSSTIRTVAGTGSQGSTGDGGQATAATLNEPFAVAFDASGNLFIADLQNNLIRKVTPAGVISTFAGTGTAGTTGDGGQATAANISSPGSLAVDASGNLYFADNANHVRKVTPGGIISTIAGTGTGAESGDGGQATAADLYAPYGLAFDADGNLFIADYSGDTIREITTDGIIHTVVGTGTAGSTGDGGQATAATLNGPFGVAVDAFGNLYISDATSNKIREVTTDGVIRTLAGTGTSGSTGDGGAATDAKLNAPGALVVDAAGNLYLSDNSNNTIREITKDGVIHRVAGAGGGGQYSGDGGASTSARLDSPGGLALDALGNLYIADASNNAIREVLGGVTVSVAVHGAATHLGVTGGVNVVAGTVENLTVTALDAYGNVDTGYTETVHLTSTDGQAVLPSDATLTNGVGSFSVTLKTAGTQTITATDTVTSSVNGSQSSLIVTAAAATHLGVTGGVSVVAGTVEHLTIAALDQYGNTATSYTGTVHVTSSDGQAVLPGNATLTNGVGSFDVTLKTAGTRSITATDTVTPSITGVQSGLVVTHAAATHYTVTGGVNVTAGGVEHLTVTALDPFGNTATGYSGTVHVTSSDGQAVLPSNAALTNGVGSFDVTLKTAGPQTITATDTVTSSVTGVQSSLIVTAAAATHLGVTGGVNVVAGTVEHLTIAALDPYGNTSSTYSGTVHITSSDGQAVLPSDATLIGGVGLFNVTLKTAGTRSITATDTVTPGITGVQSGLVVSPAAASVLGLTGPSSIQGGVTTSVTVTIKDVYGNTVTGYSGTIHFTSNDANAVLPSNTTLTNGTGTFPVTLETPGTNSITATDTVTSSLTATLSGIVTTALGTFSTLTSSVSQDYLAQSVTLTATVTSRAGVLTPTGTVTFKDGSTVLGTGTLVNGVATFTTSSLTVGTHRLVASYAGVNGQYLSSTTGLTSDATIRTVVGTGVSSYTGDGGQASAATLEYPQGVSFDSAGNMYISDSSGRTVRKVTPGGVISTIAGSRVAQNPGDGGPATNARLRPYATAVDASGNLFIADATNNVIREVTTDGIIHTIAGNNTSGYSGDGGQATAAQLHGPNDLAIDSAGNLYFADYNNNVIRKVTPGGVISTFAGTGTAGHTGDGGQASAATLNGPSNLTFDAAGNLYVSEYYVNYIRKITPDGVIRTIVGTGTGGDSGDGGQATDAEIYGPLGLAVDALGNLFFTDDNNNKVREVTPDGVIHTLAGTGTSGYSGDDGPAGLAELNDDEALALDPWGNLFIADSSNFVIREIPASLALTVLADPTTTSIAASTGSPTRNQSVTFTATVTNRIGTGATPTGGTIVFREGSTVLGTSNLVNGSATFTTSSLTIGTHQVTATYSGDGEDFAGSHSGLTTTSTIATIAGTGASGHAGDGGQATAATLRLPYGMIFDSSGNLYVLDVANNVVREITTDGVIHTVAGNGSAGYSGDGGQATAARLSSPQGIALDAAGNLYIADSGNNVIRMVTTAGVISTFAGNGTAGESGDGGPATAAMLNVPYGLVFDHSGILFVSDYGGNTIREITPDGKIYTVVGTGVGGYSGDGGIATVAQLNLPRSIALDAAENLYIADTGNQVIREVTLDGVIHTIAGTGTAGATGDGGQATAAMLHDPIDLVIDGSGGLFIADATNNVIREITPDGIIHTVAGTGAQGYLGDGGPATAATLIAPYGVAVDASGNLLIGDTYNNAIRKVTAALPVTVAAHGAATHFGVTGGVNVTAGGVESLSVTAYDAYGNIDTSYSGTVHLTSSDGQAVLPSNATLTNGVGSFSVTLKTAGSQSITATDTVTSSINGSQSSLIVTAAAATHLGVTGGVNVTAGGVEHLLVTALDPYGNTSSTYSGTVQLTSTDGQAVLPSNATLTGGVGLFNVTLKTAGTQSITATDTVTPGITGVDSGLVVTAAAATHFGVTGGVDVTAGTVENITVTALDPYGNTATGYTGTVHVTSSDGQAVLPSNATLTNGVGSFNVTLKTAGTRSITATDTATSGITGIQSGLIVTAAAASHFSVTGGVSEVAGGVETITVTALDPYGNVDLSYSGTVHVTSTDGQAVLPADATLTNGVGSFSVTLKTAGTQTITATDTVTPGITGTESSLVISPAAASHFGVTGGVDVTAGGVEHVTVTALDPFGNTVTGYSGTVHLTSSDGQAVLPSNATLTNGVGSFSVTLKTAGTQSITATDTVTPGITGVDSGLVVSPAAATGFVLGGTTGGPGGTARPVTVRAVDQYGNTATGYTGTVHFTSDDPNATLPADATLTNGMGTFGVTLQTAGTHSITATDTVTPGINGAELGIVSSSAVTSLALTSSTKHDFIGQSVTLTARVTTGSPTLHPSGAVTFRDGSTVLGTANLVNGVATFSTTSLGLGGHSLSATYGGLSGQFLASGLSVAPSSLIFTVVGDGTQGNSGIGGPATDARISGANGVVFDAQGNLFISDDVNSRIYKVTPAGIITTVVGNGTSGGSGDGGQATDASIAQPAGMVFDASGNLYFADLSTGTIRKVTPAGIISRFAGNYQHGYSGDGGPATDARLGQPDGLAIDASGNIYYVDYSQYIVREITTDGVIHTVAGTPGSDNYSGNGGQATDAELDYPTGIAVDADGNLFIADSHNNVIREVTRDGIIRTVVGIRSSGNSGDGGDATAARLNRPQFLAFDASGNLYISEYRNYDVRKVTPGGIITTVAGNGSRGFVGNGIPATQAALYNPIGLAFDADGQPVHRRELQRLDPGGRGEPGPDGLGGPDGHPAHRLERHPRPQPALDPHRRCCQCRPRRRRAHGHRHLLRGVHRPRHGEPRQRVGRLHHQHSEQWGPHLPRRLQQQQHQPPRQPLPGHARRDHPDRRRHRQPRVLRRRRPGDRRPGQ